MLDIEIPKDIREYEPKIFGNLSTRQIFCIVGIAMVLMIMTGIERALGMEQTSYIPAMPFCAVIGLLGWGDKLVGMPIERYIRLVFVNQFLAPKHRCFKMHNYLVMEFDKIKETSEDTAKKKLTPTPKKLPPEYQGWE